jgi:hypothetical protein
LFLKYLLAGLMAIGGSNFGQVEHNYCTRHAGGSRKKEKGGECPPPCWVVKVWASCSSEPERLDGCPHPSRLEFSVFLV